MNKKISAYQCYDLQKESQCLMAINELQPVHHGTPQLIAQQLDP